MNMKSGRHILALVTDAYGGRNGIAQYNRDFLGALAASGLASTITVLPRHTIDRAAPPSLIEQRPPHATRFAYSITAFRLMLSRPVDVVFCGHLYMTPLAVLLAKLKHAKLIVQLHGIEAWTRPSWLQRTALEAADIVLCVSRHTRARVLDWATIAPERVVVLPNTVGDGFTPGSSQLRAKWGLDADTRVLLTVARMDPRERYKGHADVIEALPGLNRKGEKTIYVVVGEGSDSLRLKALAEGLGVQDSVRFMGLVDEPTLVEAYRMADLFVMPSTGEGFGIAFLEAMACGTPALGLLDGGARDALADGELGIGATKEELAAAIAASLATPKRRGAALSADVRERFGRDRFARGAAEILRRSGADPSEQLTAA